MMSKPASKTDFMNWAAALALKGARNVAPNPMVGAVFIKNDDIIGEGYHERFGETHAEINAIQDAQKQGKSLSGSTLYVTLEPCCHTGKQPPCTEALKSLGLKKVVYAAVDPNPLVRGKGIQELEAANIETEHLETHESAQLNALFKINTTQNRPFIHLKTACTLDKKITLKKGCPTALTNEHSNRHVHELRARYDGILIGIQTLLIDDPQLDVRHVKGKNPIRIILDSDLKALKRPHLKIFQSGKTILATTRTDTITAPPNTTISICKKAPNGRIDLNDLLKKLYTQNIRSILVEGGETINTSFLDAGLVDIMSLIVTPHFSNDPTLPTPFKIKPSFKSTHTTRLGSDLWVESL